MDIGGWLKRIGLERYEKAFRDNEIDTEDLPELTEGDFDRLGIWTSSPVAEVH
jgi:SAM domain (Sterile alpha motif)